ncbi:MAG: hypothetical protein V2A34_06405 [Lentisphaerota bacterium]
MAADHTKALLARALVVLLTFAPGLHHARGTENGTQEFVPFGKLGIPNVSKAAYVKVKACRNPSMGDLLPYDWEPSGNAWMLEETLDPDGNPMKGRFVLNGGDLVDLFHRSTKGRLAGSWSGSSGEEEQASGEWAPANLPRDIKKVFRFLKSVDKGGNPEIYMNSDTRARLFLFALQLDQRGDQATAEKMLQEMFRITKSRETIILDALNLLADNQYNSLYRQFRADHDWAAYRDGIKELLSKYPKGWISAPAIQLLLEKVERRIAGTTLLAATTNSLTKADLALADRLLAITSVRTLPRHGKSEILWLLPDPWESSMDNNPDLEIRAQGMAAFPLLLALVNDDSLTQADACKVLIGNAYAPAALPFRERMDAAELFATLQRPATRGEVAVRILREIAPASVSGDGWQQKKAGAWAAVFREFYEKNKDASPEEIAILYLPSEFGGRNAAAMAFLLRTAAAKRIPILEKYLTGEIDISWPQSSYRDSESAARQRAEDLAAYAALRGKEVQPVIEAFVQAIGKEADNYKKSINVSYGSPEDNRKHEEQVRASLREIAKNSSSIPYDKSVDELFNLLEHDQNCNTGFKRDILFAKLRGMPPEDALGLLLCKAAAAKSPDTRFMMGSMVSQLVTERTGKEASQDPAEQHLFSPIHFTNEWKILASDDRASCKSDSYVSDMFLCLNERIFGSADLKSQPSDPYDDWTCRKEDSGTVCHDLIKDYGSRGRAFVRSRVLARLDGMPEDKLPKYPQKSPLTTGQIALCTRKLAATTSRGQAAEIIAGFSIYELMALPEMLQQDAELNARMRSYAQTITHVSVQDDGEILKLLTPWEGREISEPLVQEMLDYCLKQTEKQRPVLCMLNRKENLEGCEVIVRPAVAERDSRRDAVSDRADTNRIVGYAGVVCAEGIYGAAQCRTAAPPAATNRWTTFLTSTTDQQKEFQQAVKAFCGGMYKVCSPGFVRFVTKGRSP